MFEPSKCPSASTETSVRSKKTSIRSKKKKKQKNSKEKVRRRTERRRQQQRKGKFQRASLMFFSYTRINCRFGFAIDKPIEQQSLQKHNRSAFLCICRFGDWSFNYTATLATKTFRLLPPWRVLLKRFFEPWIHTEERTYTPKCVYDGTDFLLSLAFNSPNGLSPFTRRLVGFGDA